MTAHGTAFQEASVRGFLHEPQSLLKAALVLTHGAGGNCEAPLLLLVAQEFCSAGYLVLRFDLRFRQLRRFGPPLPAGAADDRATLEDAVKIMKRWSVAHILLGGHSYGGRQATVLAAEKPDLCSGLLLLSYPLHPPRRPDQLRTSHFPALNTPALFVHGTNDPFASIDELQAAVSLIRAPTRIVSVAGAGHELKGGKFDVESLVVSQIDQLMAE